MLVRRDRRGGAARRHVSHERQPDRREDARPGPAFEEIRAQLDGIADMLTSPSALAS